MRAPTARATANGQPRGRIKLVDTAVVKVDIEAVKAVIVLCPDPALAKIVIIPVVATAVFFVEYQHS